MGKARYSGRVRVEWRALSRCCCNSPLLGNFSLQLGHGSSCHSIEDVIKTIICIQRRLTHLLRFPHLAAEFADRSDRSGRRGWVEVHLRLHRAVLVLDVEAVQHRLAAKLTAARNTPVMGRPRIIIYQQS